MNGVSEIDRLGLLKLRYILVIATTGTHMFMDAPGDSKLEEEFACTVWMCLFDFAADSSEKRMRGPKTAASGALREMPGKRTIVLN